MVPKMGSVVKKQIDFKAMERSTCCCGPLSVDYVLVWSMLDVRSNVEMWPPPVNESWIGMRAAYPVGLRLCQCSVRAW